MTENLRHTIELIRSFSPLELFQPIFARVHFKRSGAARQNEPQTTLDWCRKFLPHHFTQPASRMHVWLGEELDRLQHERGRKINLIGPRGSAKSTLGSLGYVLFAAVSNSEPYIWIVSDTKEQAHTHLENVKAELLDNSLLAREYPHAVGQGRHWRARSITLTSGTVIESFGTGQRIRGRRRGANRPTLIICDDLQNDSHIASAAQRDASRRWFHGTLLKAGTPRTNVVHLATALHRHALALELHTAPGWTSALFPSIIAWPDNLDLWNKWEMIYCNSENPAANDEAREFYLQHQLEMHAGADVLWPSVEDLYTLMQMRAESGRTAFDREKQGSPVDPELCEWPESYFEDHIWFDVWPDALWIKAISLDPSKGHDARRGDFSAIVMLGIDASGLIYVEADLARRPTPEIVTDSAAWCIRFCPLLFGVEANQFQELLAGELAREFRRQGIHVVPSAIHNYTDKRVRIRTLGPLLSQRRLRFLRNSASTRLLVEQLRDFPTASHDDGPDALEMAWRLAGEVLGRKPVTDGLGASLDVET